MNILTILASSILIVCLVSYYIGFTTRRGRWLLQGEHSKLFSKSTHLTRIPFDRHASTGTVKTCTGKCTTFGDYIRNSTPHNHPPEDPVRTRFISTTRKQSRDEPTKPVPSLYNGEVKRQDPDAAASFPSFHSAIYQHGSHTILKLPDTRPNLISTVFGLKRMMAADSFSSLTKEMLTRWLNDRLYKVIINIQY